MDFRTAKSILQPLADLAKAKYDGALTQPLVNLFNLKLGEQLSEEVEAIEHEVSFEGLDRRLALPAFEAWIEEKLAELVIDNADITEIARQLADGRL